MNTCTLSWTGALAAMLCAATVNAGHDPYPSGAAAGPADGSVAYARVVQVQPRYRELQVPVNHEECWDEPVPQHRAYHARYQSYTPMILGGIVGGAIGNQFGRGAGRDALTAAGAVLGVSVGRDIAHRGHAPAPAGYVTHERRCRTVTAYRSEQQIDGYDVTYEYCGQTYSTYTRQPPGDRIPVRVEPLIEGPPSAYGY